MGPPRKWGPGQIAPVAPPPLGGPDDDSSNSWRTVSSLPISCTGATVATINDVIIVAGGCTDCSTMETATATSLTSVVLGQLELCD